MRIFVSLLFLITAACSPGRDVLDIDDAAATAAPYPELVPIEQTLLVDTPRLSENSDDALEARAQRLKRRAAEVRATPAQ